MQDAAERTLANRVATLLATHPLHRAHTVTIASLLNQGVKKGAVTSPEVYRACYDDDRFVRREVGILTEYALV